MPHDPPKGIGPPAVVGVPLPVSATAGVNVPAAAQAPREKSGTTGSAPDAFSATVPTDGAVLRPNDTFRLAPRWQRFMRWATTTDTSHHPYLRWVFHEMTGREMFEDEGVEVIERMPPAVLARLATSALTAFGASDERYEAGVALSMLLAAYWMSRGSETRTEASLRAAKEFVNYRYGWAELYNFEVVDLFLGEHGDEHTFSSSAIVPCLHSVVCGIGVYLYATEREDVAGAILAAARMHLTASLSWYFRIDRDEERQNDIVAFLVRLSEEVDATASMAVQEPLGDGRPYAFLPDLPQPTEEEEAQRYRGINEGSYWLAVSGEIVNRAGTGPSGTAMTHTILTPIEHGRFMPMPITPLKPVR